MFPYTAFNISNFQLAHGCSVLKIEGFFKGTTADRYLQVYDHNNGGTSGYLLKQWVINQNSPFYFEFKRGDLVFGVGCYIAISTTDGTFAASTDTMDISVEVSDPDRFLAVTNYYGGLSTPVTGLQVWSEAAGAIARKTLMALEVDGTNLTGGTQFIMLFATDTVNTGDAPMPNMIFPIAAGQVRTGEDKLSFGELGVEIFTIDGEPNDQGSGGGASPGTKRLGCTIKISSTPLTYTPCNGTCAMLAEYRKAP